MKLLHIIATPRENSNTMRISKAFLESLSSKYSDLNIEEIDLFQRDLPSVAGDILEAKYNLIQRREIEKSHEHSWKQIEFVSEHFLAADVYLITSPMWNFSIPYTLKYYIDCIVQPGLLFRFNEQGYPEGLALGKKMVCVTSRGSNYAENTPMHIYDFQEPYLRAIFGYCGITDISFINAQPMDITPELREIAINTAIKEAQNLVVNFDWNVSGNAPV